MKTTPITSKENLYENLQIFHPEKNIYRKIKGNIYGDHVITFQLEENDEDYVIYIGDIINEWVIPKELNIYNNLEKKLQKIQELFEKYEEILPENILMFNENLNELLNKIQENKSK